MATKTTDRRRIVATTAVAVSWALLAIPAIYAVERAVDVLFRTEPNPALVAPSPRIAMFVRLVIALYVAPVVAVVVYELAARDAIHTIKALRAGIFVVAVLALFQAVTMP